MDFFRGVGRRLEIGIGDFGGFLNRKREKKQTKRKKGWECLHAFGNSWKNYGEVFFLSYIYITFRVLVCGCEICAFKSETVRKDNDIHHFLPPSILNQKKSWNFLVQIGLWGVNHFHVSFAAFVFSSFYDTQTSCEKNLPQIYHTLVLQILCEKVNCRRDWSTRA